MFSAWLELMPLCIVRLLSRKSIEYPIGGYRYRMVRPNVFIRVEWPSDDEVRRAADAAIKSARR